MNVEFLFDRQLQLLRVIFRGPITDRHITEAMRKMRELRASISPSLVISDFTAVTSLDISSDMIHSISHTRPAMPKEVPQAIVAPQDYVYGLARMFQTLTSDERPNMHVVRSLAEAYKVLKIEEPPQFEELKVA